METERNQKETESKEQEEERRRQEEENFNELKDNWSQSPKHEGQSLNNEGQSLSNEGLSLNNESQILPPAYEEAFNGRTGDMRPPLTHTGEVQLITKDWPWGSKPGTNLKTKRTMVSNERLDLPPNYDETLPMDLRGKALWNSDSDGVHSPTSEWPFKPNPLSNITGPSTRTSSLSQQAVINGETLPNGNVWSANKTFGMKHMGAQNGDIQTTSDIPGQWSLSGVKDNQVEVVVDSTSPNSTGSDDLIYISVTCPDGSTMPLIVEA